MSGRALLESYSLPVRGKSAGSVLRRSFCSGYSVWLGETVVQPFLRLELINELRESLTARVWLKPYLGAASPSWLSRANPKQKPCAPG